MGASGRVARDPSECGGAPSRLSATRSRAPSRFPVPTRQRPACSPASTRRRPDRRAAPFTAELIDAREGYRMTYKTKRSLAQLGKHARNMPKLQHPDEAPTPSKQRCSHGYPVRRPPTRRRPRRTPPSAPPARPPSARPCAPSRPSSSWPTCTRCPWKTPTSTQRLPCSPPSLPPGCSMPDGLLDG